MLSTHLTRRQLFSLIYCNNANFSMHYHVPVQRKTPLVKYNNDTAILPNKQQFRSFWLSRPIPNASDDESYINLDHLWTAKPAAMRKQNKRKEPKNVDWWTKQQEKEETGAKSETVEKQFARKSIRYGQQQQKWLNLKYEMGKSGQKILHFNKTGSPMDASDFPNICVPEDVFAFVSAMDEVLNAVEANRDKIEAQINDQNQPRGEVLHTAMAKGTNYDFKLELWLRQSLFVNMRTVPNEQWPDHKPRLLSVPIGIFHWIRRAIGEVFVENGEEHVQQQLGGLKFLEILNLF